MKKLLALCLCLALCLPAAALADVLADGWQEATLEELQAAQQSVADRISELRAAQAPAGDAVELSGNGVAILSDVAVEQAPVRVIVNGTVKVTFSGGSYDHGFNIWQEESSCEVLTEAATYELLVEGEGDWSIRIEPLQEGGTLELTGTGPYVSDFFELPGSTIVHCTMDATKTDARSASLYIKLGHQFGNISAWDTDNVVGDSLFSAPLKLEGDGIIKPVKGRTQYYWIIDVPVGAQWAISLK